MMEFAYAFFATAGFAVLFRAPFRSLVPAGVIGGIGWMAYVQFDQSGMEIAVAAFFAALIIGLLGEFLAKKMKMPATTFVVPGIVTIVPGYGIYQSVLHMIQQNMDAASREASAVALIGVSIAIGVIVASSLSRVLLKAFGDTSAGFDA